MFSPAAPCHRPQPWWWGSWCGPCLAVGCIASVPAAVSTWVTVLPLPWIFLVNQNPKPAECQSGLQENPLIGTSRLGMQREAAHTSEVLGGMGQDPKKPEESCNHTQARRVSCSLCNPSLGKSMVVILLPGKSPAGRVTPRM